MATRQNLVFLYARVSKPPALSRNRETGEYNYGMVYLDCVRGLREVDDGVRFVKHDYPLIISREKNMLDNIAKWKENDVVLVKGTISTKPIPKKSYCPECKNDDGTAFENTAFGNLVYITPIYLKFEEHFDTKELAVNHIIENREISNQVFVTGTLLKDPKFFTTNQGVQITQYPIAINRKFIIRADDPSIRTDWPMVKSYGEQARDDKTYLKYQSDVIIDGFLQARRVQRKCKCQKCNKIYPWQDNAMEIVPYEVEYVSNYLTPEEVEAERKMNVEKYKQMLFTSGLKEELDEDMKSEDMV